MTPSISSEPAPLAIAIGVVGHRDLRPEDRPVLENRVREVLSELKSRYRATQLVLLSALAEGADRLVARVALGLGYRLIAPLPFTREEYIKDFPDSVAEFDELLARAETSFPYPAYENPEPPSRTHCYAGVGAYIVQHSQILLALWDGRDSKKIGGTAHVVKFKREGIESPYGPTLSPLDIAEGGPVYQIVTPRVSHTEPLENAFSVVKLFPPDLSATATAADKASQRVFACMDRFNRDATKLKAVLAEQRQKSQSDVFPPWVAERLPDKVRSILSRYAVADALAIHFVRRMIWTLRLLLILALAAAVVFQAYAYTPSKPAWLLAGYLVLAYGACPLVYFWARFVGNYQNKYLDYRALAEGLRVLMFWRLAGLNIQVADHYLRKQRSEMDWIRQAIRAATIPLPNDTEPIEATPGDAESLKLVLMHWVQDQAAFFRARCEKDSALARRFGLIGAGLFLLGFLLPLGKLVTTADDPIVVAMSITVVVAALVQLYSQVLGFSEHARQYERMQRVYRRGAEHLQTLLLHEQLEEARVLIGELGRESLIENGEWLLFHRLRPVQVPGQVRGDA